MNAYDHPDATAAHLEKLNKNKKKIAELRKEMKNTGNTYREIIRAFTELFILYENDPRAQKRLVLELDTLALQKTMDEEPKGDCW